MCLPTSDPLSRIEARLTALTWLVTTDLAVTLALAGPAIWLRIASKVGAL
jgi:hypothetical protein